MEATFYNVDPENSFEFFPRKEETVRPSAFLERSLPTNMFPRSVAPRMTRLFTTYSNLLADKWRSPMDECS